MLKFKITMVALMLVAVLYAKFFVNFDQLADNILIGESKDQNPGDQ